LQTVKIQLSGLTNRYKTLITIIRSPRADLHGFNINENY
jgi:hypothetical protein